MDDREDDMNDYLQTQNDKKCVNTPTKSYARTTDYEFGRFSINHQANSRDEYLQSRLERIKVMRDFEASKDPHTYSYTDAKRKGDSLIYKNRHQNTYSKIHPDTLHNYEEEGKTCNMGLGRYLKMLSQGEIQRDDIGEEDMKVLDRIVNKYKQGLYYDEQFQGDRQQQDKQQNIQQDNQQEDMQDERQEDEYKEDTKEDPREEYIITQEDHLHANLETPSPGSKNDTLKRYSPIYPSPSIKSCLKPSQKSPQEPSQEPSQSANSFLKSVSKRVTYNDPIYEEEEVTPFVPTQSKDLGPSTHFEIQHPQGTDVDESYYTERQEYLEDLDEYNQSREYQLDDGTVYFTNGPYYKDEMHTRVERHHQKLIRNPDKLTILKPEFYSVSGGYQKSKEKRNQEFIDMAYYDICIRGYLRGRKRYKTSYPIYGETLHEPRSSNRVILHDSKGFRSSRGSRRGREMYSVISRKEVEEALA